MLNRKTFFIREHVGFVKFSDTYDILDPETQAQLGIAKEKPSALVHVLRLLVSKQMLPTKIFVYSGSSYEDDSKLLFSIERGVSFLRSRVNICDRRGKVVGWLKSKVFSLGGAFFVYDDLDTQIAMVKGDWKGWHYRLIDASAKEMGTTTKKWAGIGKELFTTADNYIIALNCEPEPAKAILLLAAGLAVDTIYKEK